jgi:hypothetical protein
MHFKCILDAFFKMRLKNAFINAFKKWEIFPKGMIKRKSFKFFFKILDLKKFQI